MSGPVEDRNIPRPARRRLFWLLAVLLLLAFATVAYVLHRARAASHVVVMEAVDDATGQTLPLTVEFPPSKQGLDPWMPEVVVQSPNRIQMTWDDTGTHVIRAGSPNYSEKNLRLDQHSAGKITVRLVKGEGLNVND
jgi:hypothetical protein